MLTKKIRFTLFLLAGILALVSVYTIAFGSSYTVSIPLSFSESDDYDDVEIKFSQEGVVSYTDPVRTGDCYKVTFNAESKGETNIVFECRNDGNISFGTSRYVKVGAFNIIFTSQSMLENSCSYALYYGMTLFFCIMAVYMIIQFRRALKTNIYSYSTILYCSIMIICICVSLILLCLSVYYFFNNRWYEPFWILEQIKTTMFFFIFLSQPFVLIFSILISISNISLIRHEGFRFANLLGIIISIVMIVGIAVCIYLPSMGLMSTVKVNTVIIIFSALCTLLAFFECLLLGTMICGVIAAKHKPSYNKDYLIILGCGIREDGTLLPLLRGRVDKAIEFYYEQLEKTGKKAVFVPSGGQGSDEIISEGEAMKRYLIEQGIPEEQIMPETKSTNTLENMKFSKKLIDEKGGNTAFSTTNYHVFRSGILAGQANLKAEGMGSKTKWYFWPNAFMREFVGLLATQPKKYITLGALITLVNLLSNLIMLSVR